MNGSCFPQNSSFNLTLKDMTSSPCTNGKMYGTSLDLPTPIQSYYTFNGTSKYDQCLDDISMLFNSNKSCQTGTDYCSFKDAFISDIQSNKFLVNKKILN